MLGLGENTEEIHNTLKDLLNTGCRLLTLGQYLQPTKAHLPVKRFVPPREFDNWRKIALEMGFIEVACGPFVRSSYQAKKLYRTVRSFSNHSN
jgi:lipoic acid synthetase